MGIKLARIQTVPVLYKQVAVQNSTDPKCSCIDPNCTSTGQEPGVKDTENRTFRPHAPIPQRLIYEAHNGGLLGSEDSNGHPCGGGTESGKPVSKGHRKTLGGRKKEGGKWILMVWKLGEMGKNCKEEVGATAILKGMN